MEERREQRRGEERRGAERRRADRQAGRGSDYSRVYV